MIPTCREVARKLAEGEYDLLPWYGQVIVRVHLMICKHCCRIAHQLDLISQALRASWKRKPDPGALDAVKRRILMRLRSN